MSAADSSSAVVGDTVATREEQLRLLQSAESIPLTSGDVCYIIDYKWFMLLKEYLAWTTTTTTTTGGDADTTDAKADSSSSSDVTAPAAISNTGLLLYHKDEEPTLKKKLVENSDYGIISSESWKLLVSWYGGGPAIPRHAISLNDSIVVEVYPLRLPCYCSNKSGFELEESLKHITISKSATVGELRSRMARELGVEVTDEQCRVWRQMKASSMDYVLLSDLKMTLDDARVVSTCKVLLETQDGNGNWIRDSKTYKSALLQKKKESTTGGSGVAPADSKSSATSSAAAAKKPKPKSRQARGLCGLSNLGNTCFMNSALQCLSNTPPLTDYFLRSEWRKDLNSKNPLGMGGKLAQAYSSLLAQMWSGSTCVRPDVFKSSISRFAKQFVGYRQHDSQELLAFLLDGLHEDLNRVKNKQYVLAADSNGRDDRIVAGEAWNAHLKRNDSVIVDNFQGQFKSTVVCPTCARVSVTFDPFMYISLPVATSAGRFVEVAVKARNEPVSTVYAVQVGKDANIGNLKEALSDVCGIAPHLLQVVEVHNSQVFREFGDHRSLSDIRSNDRLFAYESLPRALQQPRRIEAGASLQVSNNFAVLARRAPAGSPEKKKTTAPAAAGGGVVQISVVQRQYVGVGEKSGRSVGGSSLVGIPFFVSWQSSRRTVTNRQLYGMVFDELKRTISTGTPSTEAPVEDVTPVDELEVDAEECSSSSNGGGDEQDTKRTETKESVMPSSPSPSVAASSSPSSSSAISPSAAATDPATGSVTPVAAASPSSSPPPSLPVAAVAIAASPDTVTAAEATGASAPSSSSDSSASSSPVTGSPSETLASFPYTLVITKASGDQCARCRGATKCGGCAVPIDDATCIVNDGDTIAVAWHADSWTLYDRKEAERVIVHESVKRAKGRVTDGHTLDDCFRKFTTTETLSKDEAWYCSACKDHKLATKKFELWRLPRILIIHLKRFRYSKHFREKISTVVHFPIRDLNLKQWVAATSDQKCPTYDLIGISNHAGGLGGGHYTAYAKNVDDSGWYCFNDSNVSGTDESRLRGPHSYLLFYQAQDHTYPAPLPSPAAAAAASLDSKDSKEEVLSTVAATTAIDNDDDDDDNDPSNVSDAAPARNGRSSSTAATASSGSSAGSKGGKGKAKAKAKSKHTFTKPKSRR